jgi:hypothetical protein
MQIRLTGIAVAALGAGGLFPGAAQAQTLDLTINLPRLKVAEYHKPYVAVWIQKEGAAARTIAVWYDFDMKANEGTKWLRDVRRWWQVSGRSMKFPGDGVSSATRAPGSHKVSFTGGRGAMPALSPGKYKLYVEAAREAGGRELVTLDFNWNGSSASARTSGATELGAVSLTVKR